jgi:hypothetical protein
MLQSRCRVVLQLLKRCPEQNKARSLIGLEDHVCLIRLYLGKRRSLKTNHFQSEEAGPSSLGLSHFKMYFDQMIDLELHVSFIAETMADTLAVLHWKAQVDTRDVEFVLGSVPADDKAFFPAVCVDQSLPNGDRNRCDALRDQHVLRLGLLWRHLGSKSRLSRPSLDSC